MLGNAAAAYAIALVLLSLYGATGLLGGISLGFATAVFVLGALSSLCVFNFQRGKRPLLCAAAFNLLLAGVLAAGWPTVRDVALTIERSVAISPSAFAPDTLGLTALWLAAAGLLLWHAWLLITWPIRRRA